MKKGWFLILVLVLLVYGCSKVSEEKPVLNEIQTTACESASSNNNCDRLDDLGLVSGRDCCYALSKCCGDDITGRAVQSSLSDIQITACETAASNNTCSKLDELGLVTDEECCSAISKCCGPNVVSIGELKTVLIDGIKDYFSSQSPKLTTAELKDLIVSYFSTIGDTVDLSGIGEYSGEKLIDIYNKAKGITTCTPNTCSSLGKECGSWPDGCGGTLNCGTCSTGKTCTNGQCVTTGTTSSITVLTPNAPMGTFRAGETYDIRVLCKNIDKVLNIFLIDERIAPPSRSEIMFNFVTCKNAKNDYEWTTYNWTIPLDITSDDREFAFRIRAETLDSLIGDESDYSFSIDRPLPSITVLSPNGGETLTIGTDYTIKWDSTLWWAYWSSITDPSALRLEVYSTNSYYKGRIGDVWDTGSFIWKVGEINSFLGKTMTLPAGYYIIRITRISAPGATKPVPGAPFDESDASFSIVVK